MKIQLSTSATQREGFWYSKAEPQYPKPAARERKWAGQTAFVEALTKVQKRANVSQSKGKAPCRICRTPHGAATYNILNWAWPSGFMHYVVDHNVKPADCLQWMLAGGLNTSIPGFNYGACSKDIPRISWRQLK